MFHRTGTGRLTGIILRLKEYSAFITALSGSFRHMPRVTWLGDSGKTVYCDYVRGMESYMNHSHNLCDLLGLETLLLKYDGLLLHSSFIRWRGEGILFSAPSGTGKSTQADLWVKYEDAEILNGDRAGTSLLRASMDGVRSAAGRFFLYFPE